MDQSTRMMGMDAQGNVVFTVVKPVVGIFQVSSEETSSVAQGNIALPSLSENLLVVPQAQEQVDQNQLEMYAIQQPQMQESEPVQAQEVPHGLEAPQSSSTDSKSACQMPFAEVSSLLDPNMKGSKARKNLISYDEIKRRLQAPEKMSLRSLAAYTRVSRGPASRKTLLESLNVLGLTPSTTTSVSSSFSKLTEGDTRALCEDMKDFAHDYINYSNMAKQLIPETNTVQHWSKMIESKNHLEDIRKHFKDPVNSEAFDNVTHGLGLSMMDAALDVIIAVIEQQIRVLSGEAASDPADSGLPARRIRRRHRKNRPTDDAKNPPKAADGAAELGKVISKSKSQSKGKKKTRQDVGASDPSQTQTEQNQTVEMETDLLALDCPGL